MTSKHVLQSDELMAEIYNNINGWKDKLSFASVNSFFHTIAFNTTTDIVYQIHSEENLLETLPPATATTVHLHLDFQLKQAFLNILLVIFTKTNKVLLSTRVELNVQPIEKLCKTAAKKGINITVVSSDQKEIIEDMMKRYEKRYKSGTIYEENRRRSMKCYEKKYKKRYREYEENQGR